MKFGGESSAVDCVFAFPILKNPQERYNIYQPANAKDHHYLATAGSIKGVSKMGTQQGICWICNPGLIIWYQVVWLYYWGIK